MRLIRRLDVVFYLLVLGSCLTSCVNSKKAVYFNDLRDTLLTNQPTYPEAIIQQGDLLNITVSSLNPEASLIFNTPNLVSAMSTISPAGSGGGSGTPQFLGFLVSTGGEIKYPVLGSITASGLTKKQLEDKISEELVTKKLLLDPIVNVRFLNFRITVLGEVNKPTTFSVVNERITLLEALGFAGDLTIYGKRGNILLIREEGTNKIIKRLNLNDPALLSSPFFYLKANDVVYVEPGSSKIAASSRTQQILPIALSGLSFVAIILSYYIKK